MSDDNGHHGERVIEEIRSLPLPPGWVRTSVGEVGAVRLGRQRSPKNRSADFPTKYVRAANITWAGLDLGDVLDMEFRPEERASYRLQAGDVLLSEASGSAGEVGKPAIWNGELEDCCFQNTVIRFRPKAVTSRYALLAFQHYARNRVFARVSKGVGIHHLSADRFASMPFLLPPAKEQDRIVAKTEELLSELDAGITALERARANLKRYRAALLKAAVEGTLTGAWRAEHPDTEPASKLLDRILAERRRKWEADQLAKFTAAEKAPPKNWQEKYVEPLPPDTNGMTAIPDGWCWVRLSQVALFQNGHAYPSKEYADSGIKLLRPGNLFEDGSVRWIERNTRYMPIAWSEQTPHHIVGGGELVMNLTAQSLKDEFLGRTCLTEADERCLLNQRLARISACQPVTPKYLLIVLKSRLFRDYVRGLNTGSLIQHMFTSQLSDFVMPLASLAEQEQIVRGVAEGLSLLEAADNAIGSGLQRTNRLRQSILKQAFEGKLVRQDPTDEPASTVLERLRASRSAHEDNGNLQPGPVVAGRSRKPRENRREQSP